MENILLPNNITFEEGERPNEGQVTVEPCFYGYGTTLGNAFRRVLLSSLAGAAVTAVKIKGVTHEFQSIENVKEDVLEVILNLKSLRLKLHSDEPVRLTLTASGKKAVQAKDIDANADVEIVNGDLKIATITDDKATLEMEITVAKGRGYSPTEEREMVDQEIGTIGIDALFSPVRNVGYKVENTRVGEITNFDKLIMTIETDGTVSAKEAVQQSAKILIDYFTLLTIDMGASLAQEPEENTFSNELPEEEPEQAFDE
jgi:DNA-directed RNA polymerase subunit alpha